MVEMILHIQPAPYNLHPKQDMKPGHTDQDKTHCTGAFLAHNQNGKEVKTTWFVALTGSYPQLFAADADAAAAAAVLRCSRRTPNIAAPGEDPEKTFAR